MNESTDRVLADWLHEGPDSGPRDGLERALSATRRVGQRPGWTIPERWIPMQRTTVRTRTQLPVISMVPLALLILALVAAVLYVGSQQRQTPTPFRNGALVWAADGDLFIADKLGDAPRALVAGPEKDSDPVFSDQGDRIAFVRVAQEDWRRIMSVNHDGTGLIELANLKGGIQSIDWSPDGAALLVTRDDLSGEHLQTEVVDSHGLGSTRLDIGGNVFEASWRPGGGHIALHGYDGADESWIADADGADIRSLPIASGVQDLIWSPDGKRLAFRSLGPGDNLQINIADIDEDGAVTDQRRLPIEDTEYVDGLQWSPDGKHLSVVSVGPDETRQINIVELDADGRMTGFARLDLDVEFGPRASYPTWSPDSRGLAFVLRKDAALRVGIADPDGSGYRLVGPEVYDQRSVDLTWAPDGQSLVVFEHPVAVRDVPVGPYAKAWAVDVASGEQTEVQTPAQTWQRLEP